MTWFDVLVIVHGRWIVESFLAPSKAQARMQAELSFGMESVRDVRAAAVV